MDRTHQIDIDRERSVADIIGSALDMYQSYPLLFLTLALGVIAPYQLAVLAINGTGPLAGSAHGSLGAYYLLMLLDYTLVGPLVSALHIHAVIRIGQGDRPRLAQIALRGLRVLPVVAAAVIVADLGIALGFLALIVPGVLLVLRWSVVAQVAAVEHEGWIPSLRRSSELTRGHYWHILGLLVITVVVSGGVNLGAVALPLGSTSGAASVAVGIATRTITASFSALTLAILFFDLRARAPGGPPVRSTPEYQDVRDLDPQGPDPRDLDPQGLDLGDPDLGAPDPQAPDPQDPDPQDPDPQDPDPRGPGPRGPD
jgi:hypothetical protein